MEVYFNFNSLKETYAIDQFLENNLKEDNFEDFKKKRLKEQTDDTSS